MQDHEFIYLISGTNRPRSSTARVAGRVREHYEAARVGVRTLHLDALPTELFHPDAYAAKPAAFEAVQRSVLESAGLHLVVPEYNGSFPGVLKYVIDLLKFPESFDRKPVAFVGLAAGAWGGLRAVEQLQMVFGYRNAHLYPDRVFIPGVNSRMSAEGKLADAEIDQRLRRQVEGFAHFCGLFGGKA